MDVTSNPKIGLSPAQKEKARTVIRNMTSQVSFLSELLRMDACGTTDANTHLSLLKRAYDDLSALFGYDGISKELDRAHSDCRAANLEIAELKRRLGRRVTAEGASSRLNALEKAFHTWRALVGLDYASTEWNAHGIAIKLAGHVNHEPGPDDDGHDPFGDDSLMARARDKVGYAFHEGWDLKRDSFHDDLLDTDDNRRRLEDLLKTSFPGSNVHGFSSHRDGTWYLLRMEAFVPWEAIETWLASVDPTERTDEGMYYVKLREIQATLASDRFTKQLGPAIERNLLQDAGGYQKAITAYEALKAAEKDRDGRLLASLRVEGPEGKLTIARGTGLAAAGARLEKAFGLDIRNDLDPSWDPDGRERS